MPQIKTQGITIYSDHISISKKLRIDKKIARELHKILGGFLGYKELMYVNCATAWRAMPMKPIKLSAEDVESLKRIGTQRIIHSEICYIIPVEKLPEKLKRYASPPEGMLRLQKDYSEEEVEIFIEGKPLRVKGMPSRIKGEVRIYPDRNTIFWTLKPATAKTIKEKWKGLKPLLQKEIIEGEKKEEEST